MNVLLVNANRFKQPWPVIPFGLCAVASAIEEAGHQVRVLDLCFSRAPADQIRDAVRVDPPDVVGVSVRNIDNSVGFGPLFLVEQTRTEVIEPLSQAFAGPIVIGGPSVGINAPEMLGLFGLRYAIQGDGETAMVAFLQRQREQLPLDDLPGLVIREPDGRISANNPPCPVADLDALPFVRPQRYVDLRRYGRFDSPLQIQTKRGCALSCAYCTYNNIEGRSYRLRSPERVADEIEQLVHETGVNHIEFVDSTFNIPIGHCKSVLRAVKAKGLDLRLRTMGLNPATVDEELVDLLEATGFRDVDLGAESACDVTLRGLGKSFAKDDVVRAGRLLRQRGIPVTWYLLVGAPGETPQTLRETFDTVNRTASEWDLVNIGVGIRVYKGSPMAAQMKQRDAACTPDNFLRPVHFDPPTLDLRRIKALTKQSALRHPNYFMFDEDEDTPIPIMMVAATLLRWIAPRKPIWKLFILLRKLQRLVGITLIKRAVFYLRNRHLLKAASDAPKGIPPQAQAGAGSADAPAQQVSHATAGNG